MTEPSAHATKLADHVGSDHSMSGEMPPVFDQLVAQTWTEMEDARLQYNRDAKRLRFWQWWFVGMFTFYTTLVGILLVDLVTGS